MNVLLIWYGIVGILFFVYSFGFLDPGLRTLFNPTVMAIIDPLTRLVYAKSPVAAGIYTVLLLTLFILYALILRLKMLSTLKTYWKFLLLIGCIFFLSYPALSHDIFNYILTAKVAFYYQENPYLVMPTELLGEPMLGFTRAANKYALYGPVWILSTWIPQALSFGNVLVSIYTFKLLVVSAYIAIGILIYQMTKSMRNVLSFVLNPLVIIETFVSGHNDVFMMALALFGIFLWNTKHLSKKLLGFGFILMSVLVKGATIVLVPLFLFFHTLSEQKRNTVALFCMFGVFLLTPFREEMYPWYATWFLVFVALLPIGKRSFFYGAAYMLSLGLMLRYVPWIATREYGGTGPMIRLLVTWAPLACYSLWYRIFPNNR